MYKKIKIFCLFFLMLFCSMVLPVQAVESQDENLKVDYSIEKTSEKNAVIKIRIQNISNNELENINLKNNIPDAFTADKDVEMKISSLASQETKEMTVNVQLKNNNVTVNTDDSQNNQNSKPTKTGDTAEVGKWLVVLGISAAFIFGMIKIKKRKSLLALLLVSAMLMSSAGSVKATDVISKEIHVKDRIVFNNTDYEFGLDISYDLKTNDAMSDSRTITRGEWINKLVNAMHYEKLEVINAEPYFTDTAGSVVEDSINYAVAYRIVDLDNDKFYPDMLASREFIAVTTIKALGFYPQEDLTCADASEVKDLKNAYLAVKLNVIDLVDNHFYPNINGTVTLANQALGVVEDVLASTEVGNESYSKINYRENVIVLSGKEVNLEGTVLKVDKQSVQKNISVGDIIVIDDNASYKVSDIKQDDNKWILSITGSEMNETIESMEFEGKLQADFSQFEPAEGVTIGQPKARSVTTPDIGSLNFEIEIPGSDHIKVKGKFDTRITVTAKGDVETAWAIPPIKLKNVMLKLDSDLDVEAGIYVGDSEGAIDEETMDKVKKAFANGNRCKGSLNLGKVPVVGIPGVRVYVELGLAYDLNGYFKLIWNFDGQVGFQTYNDNPRAIYSGKSTLTPQLGGEAKIGPELAAVLKTVGFNLIDISTSAGAKGEGDIIFRPNDMICSDLAVYGYWDLSVLKNSKLHDWFGWGWSYDIWDKDNSPCGLDVHFENWNSVPECTYVDATVNGLVLDAETNMPIANAKVKAYNVNNSQLIKTVETNQSGGFTLPLKGGIDYRIETSKDGYITCKEEIHLEPDEVKQLQTRMQVRGIDGTSELGKAGGMISDAQTGNAVSDVKIKARNNWGNKTGEIVGEYFSNDNGQYLIDDLALGYYTLEFSKDNYVTGYLNIFVTKSGNYQQNIALNPKSIENDNSELRIVLTWGSTPADIDAHLIGVSPDDKKYHVYFSDSQYNEDGELICDLDVDDRSGYGPETITVYKVNSNHKFSYYLHDYSNRSSLNSMGLSNSNATVTIYVKGEYKKTIYIPTNKIGTQWHAFDYHPDSQSIEVIDEFSNQSNAQLVGQE